MENEDHSHLKVPLIIFGSLFVIIFLIMLFVALTKTPAKKEITKNTSEKAVTRQSPVSNTNEPTPTPIVVSNLTSYNTSAFQIKHPDDWGVFYYSYIGGEEYAIKPRDLEKNQTVPSIQIEINTASDSALIDERRSIYKKAKFIEETIVFQGVQSVKESGIFPIQDTGEAKPYFQTAFLFQKNIKTYIVRYSYNGEKNQNMENTFVKMLESLVVY